MGGDSCCDGGRPMNLITNCLFRIRNCSMSESKIRSQSGQGHIVYIIEVKILKSVIWGHWVNAIMAKELSAIQEQVKLSMKKLILWWADWLKLSMIAQCPTKTLDPSIKRWDRTRDEYTLAEHLNIGSLSQYTWKLGRMPGNVAHGKLWVSADLLLIFLIPESPKMWQGQSLFVGYEGAVREQTGTDRWWGGQICSVRPEWKRE